jgi:hypothetical protein
LTFYGSFERSRWGGKTQILTFFNFNTNFFNNLQLKKNLYGRKTFKDPRSSNISPDYFIFIYFVANFLLNTMAFSELKNVIPFLSYGPPKFSPCFISEGVIPPSPKPRGCVGSRREKNLPDYGNPTSPNMCTQCPAQHNLPLCTLGRFVTLSHVPCAEIVKVLLICGNTIRKKLIIWTQITFPSTAHTKDRYKYKMLQRST